jgi:hypothetical protein
MKKLLLLMAAVAMVFAFATPGIAADDNACHNCWAEGKDAGCQVGTIKCGTPAVTNTYDDCSWFDYDSKTDGSYGAFGYSNENSNCRVLFDICDCSDYAEFAVGVTIGVRMTSLTTGFYFTSDIVYFKSYTRDIPNDYSTPCNDDTLPVAGDDNLGTDYNYYTDTTRSTTVSPAVKNDSCTPNKAMVKESVKNAGFEIPINYDECVWWLNMPAMKYNHSQATRGDMVQVKIELLVDKAGMCGDWEAVCDCIVDLGIYCPSEAPPAPIQECIYFPYVIVRDFDNPTVNWTTGITVSNVSSLFSSTTTVAPADATITYTLIDSTGAVFTKTVAAGDMSGVMDVGILYTDGWTGGPPAEGRAMLKADTNFAVDGYEIMTDGTFVGSTLARGCCSLCYDD